jgi:hypothetical protein
LRAIFLAKFAVGRSRLIDKSARVAYRHDGVWACMKTFNHEQRLEQWERSGSERRRVAKLTWNTTFRNRPRPICSWSSTGTCSDEDGDQHAEFR